MLRMATLMSRGRQQAGFILDSFRGHFKETFSQAKDAAQGSNAVVCVPNVFTTDDLKSEWLEGEETKDLKFLLLMLRARLTIHFFFSFVPASRRRPHFQCIHIGM